MAIRGTPRPAGCADQRRAAERLTSAVLGYKGKPDLRYTITPGHTPDQPNTEGVRTAERRNTPIELLGRARAISVCSTSPARPCAGSTPTWPRRRRTSASVPHRSTPTSCANWVIGAGRNLEVLNSVAACRVGWPTWWSVRWCPHPQITPGRGSVKRQVLLRHEHARAEAIRYPGSRPTVLRQQIDRERRRAQCRSLPASKMPTIARDRNGSRRLAAWRLPGPATHWGGGGLVRWRATSASPRLQTDAHSSSPGYGAITEAAARRPRRHAVTGPTPSCTRRKPSLLDRTGPASVARQAAVLAPGELDAHVVLGAGRGRQPARRASTAIVERASGTMQVVALEVLVELRLDSSGLQGMIAERGWPPRGHQSNEARRAARPQQNAEGAMPDQVAPDDHLFPSTYPIA